MAPKVANEKIENLLISTNENGVSDHKTLLAAYKELDTCLEDRKVQRPVVIIADGHSSRHDLEVLRYLQKKQMILYRRATFILHGCRAD